MPCFFHRFLKNAFPSESMHGGRLRAPTRAFLRALGQDDDDIARPHVGVIHTGGEMSPCNRTLQEQAQHAKTGIYAGGGTPHLVGAGFMVQRGSSGPQVPS